MQQNQLYEKIALVIVNIIVYWMSSKFALEACQNFNLVKSTKPKRDDSEMQVKILHLIQVGNVFIYLNVYFVLMYLCAIIVVFSISKVISYVNSNFFWVEFFKKKQLCCHQLVKLN